jgi:hypothetical protein
MLYETQTARIAEELRRQQAAAEFERTAGR